MIKNVKREEVFKLLSEGKAIYAVNTEDEVIQDLRYKTPTAILEYFKINAYEYFVSDKGGKINE